jgi:hypothetical protein
MKKLLRTSLAVALAASVLISCNKADQEESLTAEETQDYSKDAEISASFDELDGIVDAAVLEAEAGESGRYAPLEAYWTKCASIEHNNDTRVTTISFTEGCEDARGITRSGSITITRTGYMFQPGAKNVAVLNGYMVNGLAVEGTRTWENITEANNPMTFSRKVEGGKVTWAEGDYATREVNHTIVWNGTDTIDENDDVFDLTGTATGRRRSGIDYVNTITDALVYTKSCQNTGNKLPVSGVMTVDAGDRRTVGLNFGEGECDDLVTVSIGARSRTIEVK